MINDGNNDDDIYIYKHDAVYWLAVLMRPVDLDSRQQVLVVVVDTR